MASQRNKERNIQTAGVSWLNQLIEEVNVPFPPKEEGWYTMAQICEAAGRDHQIMRRVLKEKKAECKKFRSLTSDGKSMVCFHYRIA